MMEYSVRGLLGAVLVLLCVRQGRMLSHPLLTVRVEDLPEPMKVFKDPNGAGYYRVLLLDNDIGRLYVGAAGYIYRLAIKNINESYQISAELPLQDLTVESCKMFLSKDSDKEMLCRNHIRVIVPKRGDREDTIYVCGTGAQSRYPDNYLLNKTTLQLVQKRNSDPEHKPDGIHCLGNPNGNLTATVVEYGNPGNIPALYMATDQIRRPAFGTYKRVDTLKNPHVLNNPEFVSSFATEHHVYFWFRELKYEKPECGKRMYSRVARVNKSDIGEAGLTLKKWQSFTKARLNCSQPGNFPYYFDEIRDVYREGRTVYAVFTTSLAGPFASAVCSYHQSDLEAVFNSNKFLQQPSIVKSQFQSEERKVLLEQSVRAQYSMPLYIQHDVAFRKIVMHRVVAKTNDRRGTTGEISVFYLGSNQGDIYKVSSWTDRGHTQSHVLAVWKVSNTPTLIWDLVLKNDFLFIATDARVIQMSVKQCGQYLECSTCHRDPHCGWDPLRHVCHRYQEGSSHIQNVMSQDMSMCDASRLERVEVVLPGEPFHLPCRSRFGVDDYVTWFHNGKAIPVDYRKYILTKQDGLMVMESTETDRGEYMCKTSDNMILHQYFVNVPAKRTEEAKPTAQNVLQRAMQRRGCHACSYPATDAGVRSLKSTSGTYRHGSAWRVNVLTVLLASLVISAVSSPNTGS